MEWKQRRSQSYEGELPRGQVEWNGTSGEVSWCERKLPRGQAKVSFAEEDWRAVRHVSVLTGT